MQIHHVNAVSACPLGGLLMDGFTTTSLRGRLTSHCLLLERGDGLALIDTGYGLRDVADPRGRLSALFRWLSPLELRQEMTALRQIEGLGFGARDVRDIVLSHLDFDHAGGLDDFPLASVHLLAAERDAALAQATVLDRMRYRPAQWQHRERWRTYAAGQGEPWLDFESVYPVAGVSSEVLLVPLCGHTLGHAGVAVRRLGDWLLLAGDAYFYRGEMDLKRPHCRPGLAMYQTLMEKDRRARLANQRRLRELRRRHGGEVTILCSHDVVEFEAAAGHRHDEPVSPAERMTA
jgi:glyoxylase-like metal-dependent hydrolase (beta-lactamase superfamily II)